VTDPKHASRTSPAPAKAADAAAAASSAGIAIDPTRSASVDPAPVDPASVDPAPVDPAPAVADPAPPDRATVPIAGAPLVRKAPAPRRHRVPSSDPAAGPALPASLVRTRRRAAPSRVIARVFEADLSAPVVAAGTRIQNVRQISERVAMGRALWRELVVGFAYQLGELNLGFTQLAALYVLAEGKTTTVADLADSIGRSPSATSRLVDGLAKRRLVERRKEDEDGRLRTVWLTPRGQAVLRIVDRARAEQFLSAVRPMPRGERALIAMGVAALATHAISRRGRLVRGGE
jgi:DNA-binding MarR family transcriptional regulator